MEQSPSWEANSNSARQEISHLLWNPQVHKCVQNSPPLVPILSQIHPVHTSPSYLILFSHLRLGLPGCFFPSVFPTKVFYAVISPTRATFPFHLIFLDFITLIVCDWWKVQVMKLLNMQFSPFLLQFLPLRSEYSLFSDTLQYVLLIRHKDFNIELQNTY